jgi:colicin import membrane protein
MNLPVDGPFVSRPAPKLAAGALALGVHVLFALLLVFGVSWQTQQPAPVMVDLWEALPKPVPPVVPPPKPRPEPVKVPEPVKAAPVPKPVVKEPPPVKAPDIALEKKKADAERLKKLQAVQQAEEKVRVEAARVAREKQLADQKKRELLRQMEEEDLMRRMADEDAASTARQVQLAEARAAASKRRTEVDRIAGQNADMISIKVNGNTRLPDNLKSNIEVRFQVKLLPTGEVVSARLTRSSGNVDFDRAVERAIYKSSPLPLPADRDARTEFVPEFTLIHSP